MKKILIAYATMAGSTREVAEFIGNIVKSSDLEVDLLPVEDVKSLAGYDTLILGSAVRVFNLLPKTKWFLRKFRKAIRKIPLAAFLVCIVMNEDTPERRTTATKFAKPIIKVKLPLSLGLFGGVMDPSKLTGYALGSFSKYPFEDKRDWDKIKDWANELVILLKSHA
jgi:menaquinone-dependent protoporphyrinogen oxidase